MRIALLLCLLVACPAAAQPLVDTLFTWQGYGTTSECRIRIYPTEPGSERTRAVVVQELAANRGDPAVRESALVAELVSRRFGLDPTLTYWIFHWGAFSYRGAESARRKELFLRATFRRNASGALGTPSWRLLQLEEVESLTDRRFRP